jgi:subtilase family serine protease
MRTSERIGCSIAIAALVLLTATSGRAEQRQEMRSALPPRVQSAELLGAADPTESLPMSLTLQLQHRDELDALLAAQQQPGSPEYHRWLSPDEFTARFAPSAETYSAVVDWLQSQGFTVRTWPHRTRVDFSGAVRQVEGTFQVHMNRYRHNERQALANDRAPTLPTRFAGAVQSLRLHTFRFAHPVVQVNDGTGVMTAMGPHDIYTSYNVSSVLDRGIDGSGQTIAIVARSDFNVSDVTTFQQQFGVNVRTPTKVFPGSNPGIGSPNNACAGYRNPRQFNQCVQDEEAEVLLDVQWASALAPGAALLVDIGDTDIDPSFSDIVNHHPEAKIISVSFGVCERFDPTAASTWEALAAQAAAQGQTVLVAAGNDGADGCQDGFAASVNALSSPAEITAVGGTALDPGFDVSGAALGRTSELVWNDGQGASGGGVSTLIRKPAYQTGTGVPSDGFRDQPDVSFMASPVTSGYVMVQQNQVMIVGGTSIATPSWAGVVALMNQATGADGSGAINDSLYALGRKQYGEGGLPVFFDTTSGDNTFDRVRGFSAGTGYDLATGWGTPDVATLVQAVGGNSCAGDCNNDGSITVDELLTTVNIALGVTPASECQSVDANGDGEVTVDEIIQALNRALNGC